MPLGAKRPCDGANLLEKDSDADDESDIADGRGTLRSNDIKKFKTSHSPHPHIESRKRDNTTSQMLDKFFDKVPEFLQPGGKMLRPASRGLLKKKSKKRNFSLKADITSAMSRTPFKANNFNVTGRGDNCVFTSISYITGRTSTEVANNALMSESIVGDIQGIVTAMQRNRLTGELIQFKDIGEIIDFILDTDDKLLVRYQSPTAAHGHVVVGQRVDFGSQAVLDIDRVGFVDAQSGEIFHATDPRIQGLNNFLVFRSLSSANLSIGCINGDYINGKFSSMFQRLTLQESMTEDEAFSLQKRNLLGDSESELATENKMSELSRRELFE